MTSEARGPLLYTYRPIPANPMTVAILLLLALVTMVIGPIAAWPEGLWPLGGLCFVPLVLVLAAMAVFKPSPALVFENGIEGSVPLRSTTRARRGCYPASDVHDASPRPHVLSRRSA